jgi:hypothetical protein
LFYFDLIRVSSVPLIGRKDGNGVASKQLPYLENQHPGAQEIKSRKLSNMKIKPYMKNGKRKFPGGVSKRSTECLDNLRK